MTLHSPEPFQREYFDWSEEEFAQRFVEKISAGRLKQNEAYIDLKLEKKRSSRQKMKAAYQDVANLPRLVKTLPGVATTPTPDDRQIPEGQQGRRPCPLVEEAEGRDQDAALRLGGHHQRLQPQVRALLLVDNENADRRGADPRRVEDCHPKLLQEDEDSKRHGRRR